jgi:HD-like signal output (HDOD) protein
MTPTLDLTCSKDQLPSAADPAELMQRLIHQAQALYSLPAVAGEVLHLTSNPRVDVRALKECIEHDPALTVKILRVVNSSLFGLSREVGDLNQALALLGIKPLKLLVLGFSLPDNLFREVARDQLDWYWRTTLTRAVAARELTEQLWQLPGDEALLAGLLQDIGVLVLLGELREPYARFLGRVIGERFDVHRLQVESLGFDHSELSAALLDHWNMPRWLVRSIGQSRNYRRLQREKTAHGQLAQVLHLAELLAQLVGQNRLSVLPELLEAGAAYCDLDKDRLNELVAGLQPKVDQLAEVLSLELPRGMDYQQALIDAHRQMAQIAEEVAQPLSRSEPRGTVLDGEVSADARELRESVRQFLQLAAQSVDSQAAGGGAAVPRGGAGLVDEADETSPQVFSMVARGLVDRLTLEVGRCRAKRQGVSVIALAAQEPDVKESDRKPIDFQRLIHQALDTVCRGVDHEPYLVEVCAPNSRYLVLSGCPREKAIALSHTMFRQLQTLVSKLPFECQGELPRHGSWNFSAGVASVGIPPRNFLPASLLETAQRCLAAAQRTPGGTVKSLEIY